jgi:hypothetical protein
VEVVSGEEGVVAGWGSRPAGAGCEARLELENDSRATRASNQYGKTSASLLLDEAHPCLAHSLMAIERPVTCLCSSLFVERISEEDELRSLSMQ